MSIPITNLDNVAGFIVANINTDSFSDIIFVGLSIGVEYLAIQHSYSNWLNHNVTEPIDQYIPTLGAAFCCGSYHNLY